MEERTLPNLLIGGVHKAATTSLHTYLSMHPDVCGSLIKELAFLLPARYGKEVPSNEQYAGHFRHCAGQKYTLETTPSYLYGGKSLIAAIQQRLGNDVRVIMILRNPVDRFVSFYRHCITKMEIPAETTLEQFLQQSRPVHAGVRNSEEEEHITEGLVEGTYADFLPDWFDAFGDRLMIVFFDDLQADTPGVVRRICDWLQIDFSVYKPGDFAIENRTVDYRLGVLHKAALWFNHHTETFWRKNIRLKRFLRGLYYAVNEQKNVAAQDEAALRKLEELYQEPNKALCALLKARGMSKMPFWLAVHS